MDDFGGRAYLLSAFESPATDRTRNKTVCFNPRGRQMGRSSNGPCVFLFAQLDSFRQGVGEFQSNDAAQTSIPRRLSHHFVHVHTCDGEMATSTRAGNAAETWSGSSNGALIRPVDIVPAYLFGPQHKSIAYGLKLDGTVKAQRSVYNDGVVFNEIRRCAMGTPEMLGISSRGSDCQ